MSDSIHWEYKRSEMLICKCGRKAVTEFWLALSLEVVRYYLHAVLLNGLSH